MRSIELIKMVTLCKWPNKLGYLAVQTNDQKTDKDGSAPIASPVACHIWLAVGQLPMIELFYKIFDH